MKNILLVLSMSLFAFTGVIAQNSLANPSINIDTVIVTNNSAKLKIHYYQIPPNSDFGINYGIGGNFTNSTPDTYKASGTGTMTVTIDHLEKGTHYSCQALFLTDIPSRSRTDNHLDSPIATFVTSEH